MFFKFLNTLEESIIALLLASMTLLVFVEVVMRFGFGVGVMWAQELTLHLSAWMVLFGVSYWIQVGAHSGVDAFVKILPSMARRIIGGVASTACLFYTGLFMKGSWVYLAKMYKIGIELDDMPIPKWIAHSILFLGMSLMAIRLLILLWGVFTGRNEGFTLADEAKESMHLAEETKASANLTGGDSA